MARKSSIEKLPSEIREKIGQLRQVGKTIDEIMDKLNEMDVDISRSALGRHVKQIEEVTKSIKQSRIVAEAIASKLGDANDNKVSRLNTELMHSLIMNILVSPEGENVVLSPEQAFFLSSSLQKLSQASKADVEREIKIRQEIVAKSVKAVEKVSKKTGISPDTLELLKKEIFGVAK